MPTTEGPRHPLTHEVLVVDGDAKIQRGMAQMLAEIGLEARVVADPARVREIVKAHPFALALIDFDTPESGAGLVLVDWLHREIPALPIVVMASTRDFDCGVAAFRAGASDVVMKAPDQLGYLRQRVHELSQGAEPAPKEGELTSEILGIQEEFLRRLMETSRRAADLDEELGDVAESRSECALLVIDDDEWMAERLMRELTDQPGFFLRRAATGGEGLDVATAGQFQIAFVSDALPDLPGTMVVSALHGQSPDLVTAIFSKPGPRPGKMELIEGSKTLPFVPELVDPRQILERLGELREAARRKGRERRHLTAFRQQNYDLLRRYAELKQRLTTRR